MKSEIVSDTQYKYGENLMVEYDWSLNFRENIVYFYYQLIRSKNLSNLELKLGTLLAYARNNNNNNKTCCEELIILYKMIAHTRDIRRGRGEYQLAYMLIWVWYNYYPELALFAFRQFVQGSKYGSWKDIKYFCQYIFNKTGNDNHLCIRYAVSLLVHQLCADNEHFKLGEKISFAAKWAPREKSKYHWLYRKIAAMTFPQFFLTCKSYDSTKKAELKAKIHLRKMLSHMNKYLHTPQIYMCENQWSLINFENVSLDTLYKYRYAFNNKNKNNTTRHQTADRFICAGKFQHYLSTLHISSLGEVGKLVKSAFLTSSADETKIINTLWGHYDTPLGDTITVIDLSSSLEKNNLEPLYNAIGLGVRVSEMTQGAFHNCLLVFSAQPTWFHFTDTDTFVDKITQIKSCLRGLNSNLEAALKLIIESMVLSKVPAANVSQLTLCIFSDMQIDPFYLNNYATLYESIKKIFKKNGKYPLPNIKFWNVRQTEGFPVSGSCKKSTLLSGYNAPLLDILWKNPKKNMKKIPPKGKKRKVVKKSRVINELKSIYSILNKQHYKILENKIISKIK